MQDAPGLVVHQTVSEIDLESVDARRVLPLSAAHKGKVGAHGLSMQPLATPFPSTAIGGRGRRHDRPMGRGVARDFGTGVGAYQGGEEEGLKSGHGK